LEGDFKRSWAVVHHYSVSVSGVGMAANFPAQVDPATNIIFGIGLSGATAQLITVSLCHLHLVPVTN
jgi:hypothetical protein